MELTKRPFGTTAAGETVTCYVLTNGKGGRAELLDYGLILRALVPACGGGRDVVLGFDDPAGYETAGGFIGATVGRCANRITGGSFVLGGKRYPLFQNDGENHLHGGKTGFSKRMWRAEEVGGKLLFSLFSPDGEEGYPGNLWVTVAVEWTDGDELVMDYHMYSDKDTVVNLTNHAYFDLSGGGAPAVEQSLALDAGYYTGVDARGLVTGEVLRVEGTPFDFRAPKRIADGVDGEDPQLKAVGGYDHNVVLAHGGGPEAVLRAGDLRMELRTDAPGMQVYSGNYLRDSAGKGGRRHTRRSGICLEPQFFPNSANYWHFPSPLLRAGQGREMHVSYRFENA